VRASTNCRRWRRPGLAILLTALALRTTTARAVGLEGAAAADRRSGVGVGTGWDQVAGVGRDAYPFVELYVHTDLRLPAGLALGAALGLRRDLADYNFALGRWRHGSNGIDAQIAIGYDGPAFHLSVGPALAGDNRNSSAFQVGLLPLGTLRLRVGRQDGWNVGLRLLENVPGAAGGGAISARLDVGLRPTGLHRLRAGLYASAAEATAGLAASDEFPLAALGVSPSGPLRQVSTIRLGCLLGSDLGHLARPELTCSAGVLF
jgi:hypothetical protein